MAAPGGDVAIANLVTTTKGADALPQVDQLRRYLDYRAGPSLPLHRTVYLVAGTPIDGPQSEGKSALFSNCLDIT